MRVRMTLNYFRSRESLDGPSEEQLLRINLTPIAVLLREICVEHVTCDCSDSELSRVAEDLASELESLVPSYAYEWFISPARDMNELFRSLYLPPLKASATDFAILGFSATISTREVPVG